jgi:hypothetical protein
MKVKDIFDVVYGVNLELINCNETSSVSNGVNFVSRTSENNGVVARVSLIDGVTPHEAGTISCAVSGSVLSTFVQSEPYYSGRDLYVLTPKIELKLVEKLFYCYVINANKYRYSYGRAANKTLKDIELPDEIPEWVYRVNLESYHETIKTNVPHQRLGLDTSNWKEFEISQLFDVKGTRTTKIDVLIENGLGVNPYVTTQATNNGVRGFYSHTTELGNVLTIDSAVLGFTSYQANNFSASDHVEKLIPKFTLNKYIGLFLSTVINRERYRYSYGRKFNQVKIKNTVIKLPVTVDGSPDWIFMENFIKQLPYSDKI